MPIKNDNFRIIFSKKAHQQVKLELLALLQCFLIRMDILANTFIAGYLVRDGRGDP